MYTRRVTDPLTIQIRVHYPDCDQMGVVHHAVYPLWFEQARTELLRRAGVAYADLENDGMFMAVIDLAVRFHQPARYDELIDVTVTCTRAAGVRVEHEYQAHREGLLLCSGKTTLTCLNREGRPQAVPEDLLDR